MRLAGEESGLRIVPFRGEYYELVPARRQLVRNLIYPVADRAFHSLAFTSPDTSAAESKRDQMRCSH